MHSRPTGTFHPPGSASKPAARAALSIFLHPGPPGRILRQNSNRVSSSAGRVSNVTDIHALVVITMPMIMYCYDVIREKL